MNLRRCAALLIALFVLWLTATGQYVLTNIYPRELSAHEIARQGANAALLIAFVTIGITLFRVWQAKWPNS